MSRCFDLSEETLYYEICWESTDQHLFVYRWRADHSNSDQPAGNDYRCGLAVYQIGKRAMSTPVQEYTWTAPPDFWTSDRPSPCQRRDALIPFVVKHPEDWVELMQILDA